jgi:hypothetical protein
MEAVRPERLPKEHAAHLQASHARLLSAQEAFQMVQTTILSEMGLPDGIEIRLDGTILWPPEDASPGLLPCRESRYEALLAAGIAPEEAKASVQGYARCVGEECPCRSTISDASSGTPMNGGRR